MGEFGNGFQLAVTLDLLSGALNLLNSAEFALLRPLNTLLKPNDTAAART
jgi:hypothetical protein